MRAVDTNILVRLVVEDDKLQTKRVVRLISDVIENDGRLFVSDIVLCEFVWVLRGCYDIKKTDIIDTLRNFLRARHLQFTDENIILRALMAYDRGKGDFSDYLIFQHADDAGCSQLITFDKALLKDDDCIAP